LFDDLASLFVHNVASAYEDYVAVRDGNASGRSRHIHTALELANALYHFREHLPQQYAKTRAQVVADSPDYRLVADVTNVTKHRLLTRSTSEGPPLVNSAEDIEERTILTQYEDDQGEYTDARTTVFVDCSDGITRNLDTALTNVLNYWGGELKRWGILDYVPRVLPKPPGAQFIPRSEARAFNLEMIKGLRWKQTWQLMKFDVSKGRSESVDLSGSKIEFKIYKPRYSVDIVATPPGGGEPISCSIDLTEEQSFALHALKTDAERKAFINAALVERQREIADAINENMKARVETKAEKK
jgi:hypothetical protein